MYYIQRPVSKHPLPKQAKKVFDGEIFDVYQWQQKMFDGSYETFEKIVRADTVGVIPVTSDKEIVITKEEQPGKPPFISIPGGRVEENEDLLVAARRELLEETGYKSDDVNLWYSGQPVSKIEWCIYTFIARNCEKVGDLKLDSGEKIKTELVSFEEFLDIAVQDDFDSIDITLRVLKARLDPQKMSELRRLFLM